jgi:hypothetical protein
MPPRPAGRGAIPIPPFERKFNPFDATQDKIKIRTFVAALLKTLIPSEIKKRIFF